MWELVDAVRDWFSGEDVRDSPLWGHEVWYWARWGKGIQFVAGLVVILDLLSPEKLRAKGAAARWGLARRVVTERHRKAAHHVEGLRKFLDGCLGFERGVPNDKDAWVAAPIPKRPHGFDEAELSDWVRATRAELHPENWTTTAVATSPYSAQTYANLDARDRSIVDRREWEFLLPRLSRYEVAAWRRLGATVRARRYRAAFVWLGAGLAWSVLALLPGALGSGPGPNDPAPWWVMLPSTALVLTGAFVITGVGDLFTARLLQLPRVVVRSFTANLLDKARPGHWLRWGAFGLFILGFFFDMLAS